MSKLRSANSYLHISFQNVIRKIKRRELPPNYKDPITSNLTEPDKGAEHVGKETEEGEITEEPMEIDDGDDDTANSKLPPSVLQNTGRLFFGETVENLLAKRTTSQRDLLKRLDGLGESMRDAISKKMDSEEMFYSGKGREPNSAQLFGACCRQICLSPLS